MSSITFRLMLIFAVSSMLAACNLATREEGIDGQSVSIAQESSPTPSETIPPTTPLPSLTPSNTLRPPPTFEPPTLTPEPSNTPTITPIPTLQISGNLPPLEGLWTATGQPSEACVPREDWQLRYEVQPGDAVASVASRYGTWPETLAEANCLEDISLIRVGQFLRVPGDLHPPTASLDCSWELLTPLNGTITIEGTGTITFNWRGPEAARYLVRLYNNVDGTGSHIREYMVEYNEYYTMDLEDLPEGGTFSWRVFPLNWEFQQIGCPESYSSRFSKAPAPTAQPGQQGGEVTVPGA